MSKIFGILNCYDSPSLGKITEKRALGSLSFMGRFAVMDVNLSNFTNSQIDNINILVRDNFRSLSRHVGSLKSYVHNTKIYRQNLLINERGIADPKYNSDLNAIRENEWALREANPDYIVIQPAHIISKIDLRDVIKFHEENNAQLTLVYTNIEDGKSSFISSNVVEVKDGKVVSSTRNKNRNDKVSVSLRTYVISRDYFDKILLHEDYRDAMSIRMLVEKLVNDGVDPINAYKYDGYVRCIDSLDNFFKISFELLDPEISNQLFDSNWPVYTKTNNSRPAIYGKSAKVKKSFIANGSTIEGTVENSIISRKVHIEKGAIVKNSIILFNTTIKKGVSVENAIIEKYSEISSNIVEDKPVYVKQGEIIE